MRLLGVSSSLNGEHQLRETTVGVPELANGCPPLCEGCGEQKLHNGKEASSLVCCNDCYRKLPKWLKEARMGDGSMVWENRLALMLVWMREANTPNDKLSRAAQSGVGSSDLLGADGKAK